MPSGLLNFYKCRRDAWRFRVERGQQAVVEFDHPEGRHWTLTLVEISDGGVRFRLDEDRPTLAIGDRIAEVTLDVGTLQMTGSLQVHHITPEPDGGATCGAEFTPATEADERMLELILRFFDRGDPRAN